jgi:hypothetical protein
MLVKLLLLAIILIVVWHGARWIARVDAARRRWEAAKHDSQAQGELRERAVDATETERCRVCGVYVAAGATQGCGRPDCPFG